MCTPRDKGSLLQPDLSIGPLVSVCVCVEGVTPDWNSLLGFSVGLASDTAVVCVCAMCFRMNLPPAPSDPNGGSRKNGSPLFCTAGS